MQDHCVLSAQPLPGRFPQTLQGRIGPTSPGLGASLGGKQQRCHQATRGLGAKVAQDSTVIHPTTELGLLH